MFITGVTPMTMYDVTSGFNIGDNISLHPDFHDLFEVDDKIDKQILQEWYSGYCFSALNLSKEKITSLVNDEKEQLLVYEQDGLLMQKVVIIFWGWEMVYCEVG